MPRLWKILVTLSFALHGVSLLYIYALIHPNPHGPAYYEAQQTKLELYQLKEAVAELQARQTARLK